MDASSASTDGAPRCKLVGPSGETTALPESVFFVLERVAEVLARGDSITIVPVGKQVTTQQAADLLNVSRQYLVRLLDEKCIPFTKTGKHRRLLVNPPMSFDELLDRLARVAPEFVAAVRANAANAEDPD